MPSETMSSSCWYTENRLFKSTVKRWNLLKSARSRDVVDFAISFQSHLHLQLCHPLPHLQTRKTRIENLANQEFLYLSTRTSSYGKTAKNDGAEIDADCLNNGDFVFYWHIYRDWSKKKIGIGNFDWSAQRIVDEIRNVRKAVDSRKTVAMLFFFSSRCTTVSIPPLPSTKEKRKKNAHPERTNTGIIK